MNEIKVIVYDYGFTYNKEFDERNTKVIEKEYKFVFYNENTVEDIIGFCDLSTTYVSVLTGGPYGKYFDFLYTDKGIVWNVPSNDTKVIDIYNTYPDKTLRVAINQVPKGAAGGFDSILSNEILKKVIEELILWGIFYVGKKSTEKIKRSYGGKSRLSEKEINDFIKSVSGAREPSIIYDAIYNRDTWTICEFNEMFCVSDEFCRHLLLGMGYKKTKERDVFLLDYNKKQEFIRKAGLIEERIIEGSRK